MNRRQRVNNRRTASALSCAVHVIRLSRHTCENCGQPGGHWVALPMTLEDVINSPEELGYYTCKAQTTEQAASGNGGGAE